jgi:DNA polymerase-3 subunit gamma/tau
MLKLLADQEQGIRRSANPRLMVETLLLRWTLMDQMVDLETVLANLGGPCPDRCGGPARAPSAPRPVAPPRPQPTGTIRDSAPAAPVPPEAPEAVPPAAGVPPETIPFTVTALEANWAIIVAEARKESPFLGEALGAGRPIQAAPPSLTIELLDPNPVIAERLTRQREVAQAILARYLGGPVHLTLGSGAPAPDENAPARPKRMSDAGARAERLQTLRKKDPALDAAADELDLEIVD